MSVCSALKGGELLDSIGLYGTSMFPDLRFRLRRKQKAATKSRSRPKIPAMTLPTIVGVLFLAAVRVDPVGTTVTIGIVDVIVLVNDELLVITFVPSDPVAVVMKVVIPEVVNVVNAKPRVTVCP